MKLPQVPICFASIPLWSWQVALDWRIPKRFLSFFEARWTVFLENIPKHCFARFTKYQRAIEPLAAVIVWHITSKIFSLFDKCKIDGSNKYDKVGDRPNKLNLQFKGRILCGRFRILNPYNCSVLTMKWWLKEDQENHSKHIEVWPFGIKWVVDPKHNSETNRPYL